MRVALHTLQVAAASLAISLTLLVASGCEPDDEFIRCTLMDCHDNVHLRFPETIPEEGEWRFTITADGKVSTCMVELPEEGLERGSCDEAFFKITYGWDSDRDKSFPSGIRIPGAPTAVTVTVQDPSRRSFVQSMAPSYEEVAPNGRECGPICRVASGTLHLKP